MAEATKPKRTRREETPEVKYSKALSYILRHGAQKEHLEIRADGFVKVEDLLKRPKVKGLNLDALKEIVQNNEKQRFKLAEEDGVLWIRANQGHSLAVDDLELQLIKSADEIPIVVHGTFRKFWEQIKSEGLKPMTRKHIHCAGGLPSGQIISGMRGSCDLYIYINAAKAMEDGIIFEKSANDVILTCGKDGILESRYFERVETKSGELLFPTEQN